MPTGNGTEGVSFIEAWCGTRGKPPQAANPLEAPVRRGDLHEKRI